MCPARTPAYKIDTSPWHDRHWGAKPMGQFAQPEWRGSAKADAHIDDAECLKLVDTGRQQSRNTKTEIRSSKRRFGLLNFGRWFIKRRTGRPRS